MIRNLITACKQVSFKQVIKENQKLIHNIRLQTIRKPSKLLLLGGSIAIFSGGYYYLSENTKLNILNCTSASCASISKSQNSVYSQTKKHALYLTIHLHPTASIKDVSKVFCNLQKYIDIVSPKEFRDEDDEVLAGVGFGPDFLNKVKPERSFPHNFAYHERKGQHGSMPNTGGDIFIHAKSNEFSKLFELAQLLLKSLPIGTVDRFEDIYGWVYQNGRDLSGFIDGTENPADEEHRYEVAVNKETGGSFVVTQKWIHNHEVIGREKDEKLESWVGRKRSDSTELKRKAVTSHVSRMTGAGGSTRIPEIQKPFGAMRSSSQFLPQNVLIGALRNPDSSRLHRFPISETESVFSCQEAVSVLPPLLLGVESHHRAVNQGANFAQEKKFEIVRQSQPFGTLSNENGLFFIGYSSQIAALDYMLNRMVGASHDGLSDDIMKITKCVKSTYWYFPGIDELEKMAK